MGVEIGKKAPTFKLEDQSGALRTLTEYKGRWVVLYFYPKDATPGCTTEACEFTAAFPDFSKLDAVVLGVSPDSPASHRTFIEQQNLTITLLSDPDHAVAETYGAWGVKKNYGKEYEGILRSTVLIDPEGNVAKHWQKVTPAGHASEVCAALAERKRQT